MRNLTAYLFISADGVVEAPDRFLRAELYPELDPFMDEAMAEQDAVLLGRKTYEEWSAFWPTSDIEPFASFINRTPKYVASKSLTSADWAASTLLAGDLREEIAAVRNRPGKTIGVHGSIGLVQSLLAAGLLDELKLTVCPALAGEGRRLFSSAGGAVQLDLRSARSTPGGLQYLTYRVPRPRRAP